MSTSWLEVFLGLTRFCLAFLVPFVILMTVIIVAKVKPTPLIVNAGIGFIVFIGVLVLLPMDPRSHQYSIIGITVIALLIGVLFFVWGLGTYYLQSRLRSPIVDKLIEKSKTRQDKNQSEIEKQSSLK